MQCNHSIKVILSYFLFFYQYFFFFSLLFLGVFFLLYLILFAKAENVRIKLSLRESG